LIIEVASKLHISPPETKTNSLVAGLGHFLYSRHASHEEAYPIWIYKAMNLSTFLLRSAKYPTREDCTD
jgi:hypothetical protein